MKIEALLDRVKARQERIRNPILRAAFILAYRIVACFIILAVMIPYILCVWGGFVIIAVWETCRSWSWREGKR